MGNFLKKISPRRAAESRFSGEFMAGLWHSWRDKGKMLERAVDLCEWTSQGWRGIDQAKQANSINAARGSGILTFTDALRGGELGNGRTFLAHLQYLAYEAEGGKMYGFEVTPEMLRPEMLVDKRNPKKPPPKARVNNDERPKEDRKGGDEK